MVLRKVKSPLLSATQAAGSYLFMYSLAINRKNERNITQENLQVLRPRQTLLKIHFFGRILVQVIYSDAYFSKLLNK